MRSSAIQWLFFKIRNVPLLLLTLFFATQALAQLSGTKTIGSGGTYASFTDAVTALTSQGVNGAVTFNVITGVYTEQITIGQISGVSAVNTITFQSQTGVAANVTLQFTPTSSNNYVVWLNQADYITFQNMTFNVSSSTSYGDIIRLDGDANNNRFMNNVFNGYGPTSSSNHIHIYCNADSLDNTTISGNTFMNNGYGIYLVGVNSSVLSSGLQITNNTFTGQGWGGVYLNYQDAPMVNGNTITGAGQRGIELDNCNNDLQ
ncbi:MAG: right-handed parallel beta-helix repeat-containing protein, partial [Ignavibacteriae bacterium]|nr:right-handed parallel beta-helix repeat-containing protein [Ignavibacteriota bacterium]